MGEFRLRQDNLTVAQTSGKWAEEEIFRYAFQYALEGTVQIQRKSEKGRWVSHGEMQCAAVDDEAATMLHIGATP
jgi:hypothetical protein